MFYLLMCLVSLSAFSLAEETDDVAVIVTNYQYDRWGRPIGRTVQMQPGVYYNPSFNPYYNYPYYQYPGSLPGSDPDRMEDLFEQNSRW